MQFQGHMQEYLQVLVEKFWRISLYLTDDAIAMLYVTYSFVKYCGKKNLLHRAKKTVNLKILRNQTESDFVMLYCLVKEINYVIH